MAPVPDASEPVGPSRGLLSSYDRLRRRVEAYLERRGGRLGQAGAEALLLVPDVFVLLVRLTLDKQVPAPTRSLLGGALLYFVVPTDFFPEVVFGAGGFLDDVVLAAAVLNQALGDELEPLVRRHWSGREEVRTVLRDLTHAAKSLLGHSLHRRIESWLERQGVELEVEDR